MAASARLDNEPAEERLALRNSWELASVLSFLDVFSAELGLGELDVELDAQALEDALLSPPGALLRELHEALLRGIHPRTTLRPWKLMLAEKLAFWWPECGEGAPPFIAAKPAEAEAVYDSLSGLARARALRALCELRLEARGDLRDAIDEPDTSGASTRSRDWRGNSAALGQDNRGARYFVCGVRVYKERSRVGASELRTVSTWERVSTDGPPCRIKTDIRLPGPLLLEGFEVVATSGCVHQQ